VDEQVRASEQGPAQVRGSGFVGDDPRSTRQTQWRTTAYGWGGRMPVPVVLTGPDGDVRELTLRVARTESSLGVQPADALDGAALTAVENSVDEPSRWSAVPDGDPDLARDREVLQVPGVGALQVTREDAITLRSWATTRRSPH
jgi:hypothetical protein